ncbi:MAG: hypothetical protein WC821_02765 [archaeon]|jgi:hypothetical protein
MFKKALILVLFLLLATTVFSVRLIDPISKELSTTESNYVGNVTKSNTIELIFSKELVDKYEGLDVVTPLPVGFDYEVKNEIEAVKLFISIPKNAPVGDYPLTIQLSGNNRNDKVPLYFSVVTNVLAISPSNISEISANVSSPAKYDFFFVNNSDSQAVFTLTNNLPNNWNNESALDNSPSVDKVVVEKRSKINYSVTVYPRLQGKRSVSVNVAYEDSSNDFSFNLIGKPTLKSKLESVIYGLPFYSFSLLPSYFVNGLFSFYVN